MRAGQLDAHLGADTQVRIWHEVWLPVRMRLHLHVGVGHADANPGEGQHDGQDLPGPRCGKQAVKSISEAPSGDHIGCLSAASISVMKYNFWCSAKSHERVGRLPAPQLMFNVTRADRNCESGGLDALVFG